ncbi:hypothetical protein [Roseburia sp. AF25-25LB]|uniref:hypothetical protein n=1 Tax=Roseburia sp. AF25-25LB TaxID=2293135 RepID=UPI002E8E2841|nr:hypothetical protein [Roseburia sp. AF25-25LB]
MSFFATYDGSSYQLTTAGFTALVIIMLAILLIAAPSSEVKRNSVQSSLLFQQWQSHWLW